MSALIQDLLAYTRATKYEEGVAPPVDANAVLSTVLQDLQGAIQEAGATVTAEELPTVAMHEGRLAQLFQNLIGNALKYRAGAAPRIHVKADQREGGVFSRLTTTGLESSLNLRSRSSDYSRGCTGATNTRERHWARNLPTRCGAVRRPHLA